MNKSSQCTLRILYFAAAREQAQCQEEEITLDHPCTLSDLKRVIYQKHETLGPLDQYLRWAVNHSFCEDDRFILHEGDEIALIPPISGG